MATAFKEFLGKVLAPPWLQQPYGHAYLTGLGDALDQLGDRLRKAVKARFADLAPYDALAAIGDERSMPRGPSEDLYSYRQRLKRAFEVWQFAGSAFSVLTALETAGFAGAKIEIANGKQYSLDANGGLVVTTLPAGSWAMTVPGQWHRFVVVFAAPFAPALAPGGTLASSTSPEANLVRLLINKWRGAHAICEGIILITTGETWGYPTGTWGDPGNWGGETIVTWTP